MSNDSNGTASSQDFDASTSYTGRVKWFNNKAGYGFITVCRSSADDRVGDDVFVHHSGIKVGSEQYKYLVQGEYVDFTLRSSDSGAHPFQAADLTGVAGCPLIFSLKPSRLASFNSKSAACNNAMSLHSA